MPDTEPEPRPLQPAPMESTRPFPETLQALMEERQVSTRELGRRCARHGWAGGAPTISELRRGLLRPSTKAMVQLAKALDVKPETFAEYRLAVARAELDPGEVDLDAALEKLGELQRP